MSSAGFRRVFLQYALVLCLKLHISSVISDVGSHSLISYTSVPHLHAVLDDSQSRSKPGTVPLNIPGSSVFLRRCCSCRIVSSLSVPSSRLSAEWQHWERKTKPVNVCGVSCSREGLKPWSSDLCCTVTSGRRSHVWNGGCINLLKRLMSIRLS